VDVCFLSRGALTMRPAVADDTAAGDILIDLESMTSRSSVAADTSGRDQACSGGVLERDFVDELDLQPCPSW
jgi:hypothetical protein